MRYMFLIHSDPAAWATMTSDQQAQGLAMYQSYTQALIDAGVFVGADQLLPPDMTTTVTVRNGTRQVQDGPFADSKEALGGYYIIEAPDLDTALVWAERCPGAHHGTVEIRGSARS